MGFCEWFDKQDKVIRIILLIPFWGWIFSLIYRIVRFAEHKDTASLIGFILAIFFGFVIALIDLITVITNDKILVLVYGGENFGINGTVDSNNNNTEETKENSKEDAVDAEVSEVKEETKEASDDNQNANESNDSDKSE